MHLGDCLPDLALSGVLDGDLTLTLERTMEVEKEKSEDKPSLRAASRVRLQCLGDSTDGLSMSEPFSFHLTM